MAELKSNIDDEKDVLTGSENLGSSSMSTESSDVTDTEGTNSEEPAKIYTYLKRDSGYVELNFMLDENYVTGSTYEDYLVNKWVLLTDEMVEFKKNHPSASPREVIDMIEPPKPTPPSLNEVKSRKISEITQYDLSPSVNSFKLNGMDVWLDKDTRVGLMNSINIEKNAGRSETTLWLGAVSLTINCDLAIEMLSTLELYALACYNKTAEHKNIVNNLETIKEVEDYDYKIGYPEKLVMSTTSGVSE